MKGSALPSPPLVQPLLYVIWAAADTFFAVVPSAEHAMAMLSLLPSPVPWRIEAVGPQGQRHIQVWCRGVGLQHP